MDTLHRRQIMKAYGLPAKTIEWIAAGQLNAQIERAYAKIDALNAGLDAWEEKYPDAYKTCPWYQQREAWKAAGRPKAPWYEALKLLGDGENQPVCCPMIVGNLLGSEWPAWRRRQIEKGRLDELRKDAALRQRQRQARLKANDS